VQSAVAGLPQMEQSICGGTLRARSLTASFCFFSFGFRNDGDHRFGCGAKIVFMQEAVANELRVQSYEL